MRWGAVPIGLVMLGLAWLGWNIDNPTDNEIVVPAIIVDVEANAPTVEFVDCLLYTSPSPRDRQKSRMPSSA